MNYLELESFLSKKIKHSTVGIIGSSVLNRYIYSVNFDFGSLNTVIIQGAIHAREHITTDLICLLIEDVSKNYDKYKALKTPNIIFVPMLNPDGVELCYFGLKSVKEKQRRAFLNKLNKSKDFKLYKANANGVDLNTNFDAKWGSGLENKTKPSSNGFIGNSPMSEPEVQAISLLTSSVKPIFTISYHSKGQEIYYQFFNKPENLRRDKAVAKIISKCLRYKIRNLENVSGGGYKDWCILRHNIPSVTVEVGKNNLNHPIDVSSLKQIYLRNKNIIKVLCKVQKEIENDRKRKIYASCNRRGEKGR